MQLSTLIGKPVLTRAGDRLGYVTAAHPARDLKKISSLVCADDDENEFCLPARAILSVSDAVIAGGARLKAPTGIESPIGKRAYSHTGEELGALSDVELGEIPSLLITGDNGQLRCDAACATIGETVIVYPSPEDRRPAASKRRHTPKKNTVAATMSDAPSAATPPSPPPMSEPDIQKKQSAPEPPRRDGFRIDRTNLLGRRVKKSVYDETGAPIALAGERITPETITKARRKNKLLALTVNTLTNLY